MDMWNRRNPAFMALGLAMLMGWTAPALATTQLGAGLHYWRTLGDIKDQPGIDENSFSVFGSLTIPLMLVNVEGDLEFGPNYLGSKSLLIEPAAYGLLNFGMAYGGLGIGIGHLNGQWATNPFYALRAGVQLGLAGLGLDVFTTYRFQRATYDDVTQNFDMNALTFAAQVKFGG